MKKQQQQQQENENNSLLIPPYRGIWPNLFMEIADQEISEAVTVFVSKNICCV